jgi:hypothetical protein
MTLGFGEVALERRATADPAMILTGLPGPVFMTQAAS